jgi:DNA-binding winged helix-turn-helix (wHTH) protein/tetratricopeptide (TPR) repeat protein
LPESEPAAGVTSGGQEIFAFGEFELDVTTYKLRQAGREVALQPKVFDAIRHLVERQGRLVRKQELLAALWPGEHVNETAVPWTISRARKVLGQGRDDTQPIETVRGRGYRFTGEVRLVRTNGTALAAAPASEPPPAPSDAIAGAAPGDPFVGRAEVIDRLIASLQGARAGRGRLCLLTGEAGIGKTRCVNEFATVARRLRLSVWTGRCLEGGRTAAFWPWVQVLRDAMVDPSVVSTVRLEAKSLLGELTPSAQNERRFVDLAASSAVVARFWVLEQLSRTILQCAETAPRVVLLDDAHWADEASLDLLVLLAAELAHASVLVVATARDTFPPATEAWAKVLNRLGPCERIELSGLKPTDAERYVSEVTGLDFPPEIHRTVYLKCGGNPLFLQETVRLLTACCDRGGVGSLRSDDITVPGVARDVLRARLTGLARKTCEVLEVACVIGQEFELPVLQDALGGGFETLLVQLDEAVRARLVAPRARAGTYGFAHDTIREALYEELSTARRVELHCRVADALEGRAVGDFRVNELAYHLYRALPHADPGRVERYARVAGESAMRGFAYEDAAQFYTWALEAQRFRKDVDARSRCELLLKFAAAVRLSGNLRDSRKAIERAIDIARQNGFADLLLEAVRKLRPAASRGAVVPDELALHALEDASKLLSEDQRSLRIRVLAALACIPPYSHSTEKSQELSGRAVELARESGDTEDMIEALRCRLHVLSGPDHIEELLDVTAQILHLAPQPTSEVEGARYHALLHKGDMTGAELALESIGRVAGALRGPEALWHYQRLRAQQALHSGDFTRAQEQFHELYVQSRRLRLPYGELHFMMNTFSLAYERTGLTALAGLGEERLSRVEWATSILSFQAHWARFFLETGRMEDARRAFETLAHDDFAGIARDLGYLNTLAHLSLVAVALGDLRRAERLYALMKPYPHHNTPNALDVYLGSVSYFLGQLARLLGRGKAAVQHFEDALVHNGRLRFVPQLARTQLALAEVLAERGSKAGRARATELLAEAAATARRLGMGPLLDQVQRAAVPVGHGVGRV